VSLAPDDLSRPRIASRSENSLRRMRIVPIVGMRMVRWLSLHQTLTLWCT